MRVEGTAVAECPPPTKFTLTVGSLDPGTRGVRRVCPHTQHSQGTACGTLLPTVRWPLSGLQAQAVRAGVLSHAVVGSCWHQAPGGPSR